MRRMRARHGWCKKVGRYYQRREGFGRSAKPEEKGWSAGSEEKESCEKHQWTNVGGELQMIRSCGAGCSGQ